MLACHISPMRWFNQSQNSNINSLEILPKFLEIISDFSCLISANLPLGILGMNLDSF
ncbi:hypothetical protein RchiOBHm_Chr2g0130731 [Rosa chinensis]|uniref:Uncharacterized protein n=1 Tax=Rosa chinensis TaxID=74649 RepID=A0A2P6RUX1_ROSCH|nr:hypothetical protein RchiOBHm_Chr2g0130731 [Rosa chinensis]